MSENYNGEIEPTDEELITAFEKTKALGYSSSAIKSDDDAGEVLRGFLPPRCHHIGLGRLRRRANNLSRAGLEPGIRKRKPSENADAAINRLIQAYPPSAEHSEEYRQLHDSFEFRERVRELKRLLDYECLLCCRHFVAPELEGHIRDYRNGSWRKPFGVLILCAKCHGVADALRRRGKDREETENGQSGQGIYDIADDD